jgi:hypothetical protein
MKKIDGKAKPWEDKLILYKEENEKLHSLLSQRICQFQEDILECLHPKDNKRFQKLVGNGEENSPRSIDLTWQTNKQWNR